MSARDVNPDERVPVLRALATCIARDVEVRLRDETPAAAKRLRLTVEVDREAFYRALAALLQTGAVNTARLFGRALGPGEPAEIHRDQVVEFGQTLESATH